MTEQPNERAPEAASTEGGIESGAPDRPTETNEESVPQREYPKWMVKGFVVGLIASVLLCAGLGNWIMHAVMDVDADRWIQQFKDHEDVVEVLGGIEKGGYDLAATFRESNEETVAYFINGPKGTGHLVVTEFDMARPHVELRSGGKTWVLQQGIEDPRAKKHE